MLGSAWIVGRSERGGGRERGGKEKSKAVEALESSRKSKGDLMVRDYIYDFSLT